MGLLLGFATKVVKATCALKYVIRAVEATVNRLEKLGGASGENSAALLYSVRSMRIMPKEQWPLRGATHTYMGDRRLETD